MLPRQSTQLGRRPRVGAPDLAVEAAQAPESGRERDLAHGERRFVQQLLREVRAARERDGERRRAEVLQEEAPQMPAGDAEAIGEPLDAGIVECALADEAQRAGHEPGRAEPRGRAGRRFGPAAQTRSESGRLRRGGGRKVPNVLVLWRTRRTNRPAVDAGARDADEEAAVKPRVARSARAIAGAVVQFHEAGELNPICAGRLARNGPRSPRAIMPPPLRRTTTRSGPAATGRTRPTPQAARRPLGAVTALLRRPSL